MNNINQNEDGKIYLQQWKAIAERYKEMYPDAYYFTKEICKKVEEIFRKTSPFYGKEERLLNIKINRNGEIITDDLFLFILGGIGDIVNREIKKVEKKQKKNLGKIKEELEKTQKYLKYAIPELEDLIECPHCSEFNPPDKKYCVHCQEIIKEDLNGEE